jgi:hypothetical protein
MNHTKIHAETSVHVPAERARQWFLDLQTHPERYTFATHEGFTFTQGNFGEVGARFETRERFFGLRLTLRFELAKVKRYQFHFRVLKPVLPIWGAFVLEPLGERRTRLRLEIGSEGRLGTLALDFPLVRRAVQRQIQGEVDHIRSSMERVYRVTGDDEA